MFLSLDLAVAAFKANGGCNAANSGKRRRVEINLAIYLSRLSLEHFLGTNLNLRDSLDL